MAGDAPDTVADLLAMHYALAHEHAVAWHYARIAGDRARLALRQRRGGDAVPAGDRRRPAGSRASAVRTARRLAHARRRSRAAAVFEDAIDAYRRAAALANGDQVAAADLLWRRARVRMHLGAYRPRARPRRHAVAACSLTAPSSDAGVAAGAADLAAGVAAPGPTACRAGAAVGDGGDRRSDGRRRRRSAGPGAIWCPSGRTACSATPASLQPVSRRWRCTSGSATSTAPARRRTTSERSPTSTGDGTTPCAGTARRSTPTTGAATKPSAAVAGSNLGELLVSRRAYAEAEPLLRESIRVLRASRALDDVLFAEIQLGRLLVERGDAVAGVAQLAAVRAEAASLGQVGYAFEAALHLATGQTMLGDHLGALDTIAVAIEAFGLVDAVYRPTLARVRVMALARLGRDAEADEELAAGLDSARQQGLAYEEALLLQESIRVRRQRHLPAADDEGDEQALTAILDRLNIERD